MRIIITNDDGFEAAGLHALVRTMRKYGELTVVAPKRPQSGMSMAVTMGYKPIAVKKLSGTDAESWWYLDGTPASCVKYAVDNILWPERADLVISGVNHGSNAATAAVYSGTIGAAMEGAVNAIPSIGVSLDTFSPDADFSAVEELLPGILDKLAGGPGWHYGLFYNINFPAIPSSEIKGVKYCHMGYGHWEREYRPYGEFLAGRGGVPDREAQAYLDALEPGEEVYVMAGDFIDNPVNAATADHRMLEKGYITVTPHNIDNTDTLQLKSLESVLK